MFLLYSPCSLRLSSAPPPCILGQFEERSCVERKDGSNMGTNAALIVNITGESETK